MNKIMKITRELMMTNYKNKTCIYFDDYIEIIDITLNASEYDYYKCVYILNNLPYNLKKLIINIITERDVVNKKISITKSGDFINYLHIGIPPLDFNAKYTYEEFLSKLKIPYSCELVVNKSLRLDFS